MNHYFRGVCKHTVFLTTLLCLLSFGVVTVPAAEKTTDKKTTETAQKKIDLNKATQVELETLPGVGPATAQNIIAARPFKSVEELKNVSGISEARFKDVQKLVTVSGSSSASRSTTAKTTPDQSKTASSAESSSKPKPASPTPAPNSASRSARIDLNTADAATLETLPGVGPSTAQNIIAARPFKSVADLKEVRGIGEARFQEIQPLVTASSSSSSRSSRSASSSPAPASNTTRSARIDLNTADAATLETLPGVGPATAQNIIAARPFKSVDDLKDVRGIGDARFQEIQPLVTVSASRAGRPASGSPAPATTGRSPSSSTERAPAQGKVNINTATQAQLESLLGIGPAKAQAIIEGRPYKSIEDVMQVKGIKDGTFEKIQDQITVR